MDSMIFNFKLKSGNQWEGFERNGLKLLAGVVSGSQALENVYFCLYLLSFK